MAATVSALILGLGSLSSFVASPASADPLASKKAEAARVSAELNRLAQRASSLTEDFNEARLKSATLEARTRNAQAELAATAEKAKVAGSALKKMSVAAYMQGGLGTGGLNLDGTNGVDPGRAEYYIHSTANRQRDAIEELRAARLAIIDRQAGLEAARAQARRVLDQVSAKKRAAASAVSAQNALLARLKGDVARLVAADQNRRASAPRASSPRATRSRNIGTPPAGDNPAPNAAAARCSERGEESAGQAVSLRRLGPQQLRLFRPHCVGMALRRQPLAAALVAGAVLGHVADLVERDRAR